MLNRTVENRNNDRETIVFPIHYFDGVDELKGVVRSMDNEIRSLIGDVRVMFAIKKRNSIGNTAVRNKNLSFPQVNTSSQCCNVSGCLQCPLTIAESSLSINNKEIRIHKS